MSTNANTTLCTRSKISPFQLDTTKEMNYGRKHWQDAASQRTFPAFLPEWSGAAAWETIGEQRCDHDYWWGTRDGWLQLILTRLQQETTTGVDMHFSVRTGPLMNTNSQLAEDEGTGARSSWRSMKALPVEKQDNEKKRRVMRLCARVCARVWVCASLKGACKGM